MNFLNSFPPDIYNVLHTPHTPTDHLIWMLMVLHNPPGFLLASLPCAQKLECSLSNFIMLTYFSRTHKSSLLRIQVHTALIAPYHAPHPNQTQPRSHLVWISSSFATQALSPPPKPCCRLTSLWKPRQTGTIHTTPGTISCPF